MIVKLVLIFANQYCSNLGISFGKLLVFTKSINRYDSALYTKYVCSINSAITNVLLITLRTTIKRNLVISTTTCLISLCRHIKMSSPNLNNLIIVGCVLTYTSVIILGLDSDMTSKESFPYICTARAWILMSGFTLSFGSMFSKTWRVHSIFTNVQLNKKVMKDYQLYLIGKQ